MPRLTRTTFIESISDLWLLALENFHRDQALHGVLIAFNAKGEMQFLMHAPDGDAEVLAQGFVPVPGPWQDHLDLVGSALAEHQAVAAVMIGEAWTARDETAAEIVRMNIDVHEHPMREETIFLVGLWPREFVASGYRAAITRGDRGENPQLSDASNFRDGPALALVSWLAELLPAPH